MKYVCHLVSSTYLITMASAYEHKPVHNILLVMVDEWHSNLSPPAAPLRLIIISNMPTPHYMAHWRATIATLIISISHFVSLLWCVLCAQ